MQVDIGSEGNVDMVRYESYSGCQQLKLKRKMWISLKENTSTSKTIGRDRGLLSALDSQWRITILSILILMFLF
jgi:hypothetical protein